MIMYGLLIAMLLLSLLSLGLSAVFFLRNVKKVKATVIADKSSIGFLIVIAFVLIAFLILLILMGRQLSFELMNSFVAFSGLLPFALETFFNQNIFAYSDKLLLVGSKKYILSQIRVSSMEIGWNGAVVIKASDNQYDYMQNKFVIHLSQANYRKCGMLFQERWIYK